MPSLIRYETFDEVSPGTYLCTLKSQLPIGKKRTIPAFYYRPKTDKKVPVMIYIHGFNFFEISFTFIGGPESHFSPGFSWRIQFFVTELGIAFIAPNVHNILLFS